MMQSPGLLRVPNNAKEQSRAIPTLSPICKEIISNNRAKRQTEETLQPHHRLKSRTVPYPANAIHSCGNPTSEPFENQQMATISSSQLGTASLLQTRKQELSHEVPGNGKEDIYEVHGADQQKIEKKKQAKPLQNEFALMFNSWSEVGCYRVSTFATCLANNNSGYKPYLLLLSPLGNGTSNTQSHTTTL